MISETVTKVICFLCECCVVRPDSAMNCCRLRSASSEMRSASHCRQRLASVPSERTERSVSLSTASCVERRRGWLITSGISSVLATYILAKPIIPCLEWTFSCSLSMYIAIAGILQHNVPSDRSPSGPASSAPA